MTRIAALVLAFTVALSWRASAQEPSAQPVSADSAQEPSAQPFSADSAQEPSAQPVSAAPTQDAPEGYRSLETPRARIFYQPGDSGQATRVLAYVEGQVPLVGLPPAVPSGVRVYLAPDEESFDALTGGRIPDWGAAVAIPSRSTIVLPLFASGRGRGLELRTVLRHEWAHVGLHQHLQGMRIPRWFDEGYAQWASGGWDAMEGWRLRVAFATGQAPAFDSLTLAWPRDRASAELAYGLSATVLEYLYEASGRRGLEVLLARWPEMGFERALRTTYGITAGQLEEDWQKYVEDRYGWLLVVSHSLVFWAMLSVMLIVLVVIRRRRDREAMARLVATEGPDRPAYWLGETVIYTPEHGPRTRNAEPAPRETGLPDTESGPPPPDSGEGGSIRDRSGYHPDDTRGSDRSEPPN